MRLLFGICLMIMSTDVSAYQDNQTADFAAARAARVAKVRYTLNLELDKGQTGFQGVVTTHFKLLKSGSLALDFSGKAVHSVKRGEQEIPFGYLPEKGLIQFDHLEAGDQALTIRFEGRYSHNGQGLHQYVDPADQREYLYTHLEPNDAHRVFPCFDQPDIRATYDLSVLAPSDWQVIANAPLAEKRSEAMRTRFEFETSGNFSTYITHLSAGPYAAFYDGGFRYPLAIYCRQSLADYMDPAYLFKNTRRGFDFFEAYFGTPYPYKKYDQIFCPEYNIGAMENVGAVTWNDAGSIFREKPTEDQLLRRDITLYHEMAHMWFGDLVTMKWWDDLWLKESFATYMSYLAMEAMGVEDVWARSSGSKDWAMGSDQRINTHPVLAEVPDVRAAAAIFDGITYGKGFAVLRQLDHHLGGEVFRNGCRLYFKRHAYEAVTLHAFIAALEESAGYSLQDWVHQWLGVKGVNTAFLQYARENGKIKNAYLIQEPSRFNDQLRNHTMDLGLYYGDTKQQIRIKYAGAKTALPQLNGLPAPNLLIPNLSDIDFVKVVLDGHSVAWLRDHFDEIEPAATRQQLLRYLWDMLKDRRFSTHEYLEMALKRLESEENDRLIDLLVNHASTIGDRYIPDKAEVAALRSRLFVLARDTLFEGGAERPGKRHFWRALLSSAQTSDEYAVLAELFEEKRSIPGLPITAERKWRLLLHLARHDLDKAQALAQQLAKLDPSSEGHRARLTLSALNPDPAHKAQVWEDIVAGDTYSMSDAFALVRGLFPKHQQELEQPYTQRYFQVLPELLKKHDFAFVSRFVGAMFPDNQGTATVTAGEAFLKRELDPTLQLLVAGQIDDLKRDLAIRDHWKSAN